MFARRLVAQVARSGSLRQRLGVAAEAAPRRALGTGESLKTAAESLNATSITAGAFGAFCGLSVLYAGSDLFGTVSEKWALEEERNERIRARREKLEAELNAEEKKKPCCHAKAARVSFPAGLNDEWTKIYQEIQAVLDNPSYDDGSFGPVLVRLAWHAAGTYDHLNGKVSSSPSPSPKPSPSLSLSPSSKPSSLLSKA